MLNGDIYNYKELAEQPSQDEHLLTTSDTEVLLHCLSKEGISVLNKLNGMFAFAWYNESNKTLYLCRDRFGVKPLHWLDQDGDVLFSSEISPIAILMKGVKLNENVIHAFIKDTATDFNEETFLQDVYQVPPGHYLEIGPDNVKKLVRWYWGADHEVDPTVLESEEKILNYYEMLLTDAIRLRLRSDVPVCITLSGGLDSSIIYAIAKENLGSTIRPFHFMHPGAATDESEKVKRMVEHYGDFFCATHPVDECSVQDISDALNVLEFPIWNPSALAYLHTYKTIRESGFVVVLEGHGADEQLGGYPYMVQAAFNDYIRQGNLAKAIEIFNTAHETSNPSLDQRRSKIRLALSFVKACLKSLTRSTPNLREALDDAFYYKILPIVLRAFDRLTMANSLESRAPFMDYRLVEFHRKLPFNLMVSGMGNKTILRKLLKRKKLDFIYKDKVKMGFASDLPRFFANPKVKEHMLAALVNTKLADEFEQLRHSAIETLTSAQVGWKDVDTVWKSYSLWWANNKYLGKV